MNTVSRVLAVALLTASGAPAFAQPSDKPPKDKPLPGPLPMGVPYVYQPGNNYWYAPVVPPPGTYYTVYAASRPVVILTPAGPVATYVPTTPVVVGPTWALSPVAYPYPFASSGPVFGRYSWDYTGFPGGSGWEPAYRQPLYWHSYQYPTIPGRVWMGYGW